MTPRSAKNLKHADGRCKTKKKVFFFYFYLFIYLFFAFKHQRTIGFGSHDQIHKTSIVMQIMWFFFVFSVLKFWNISNVFAIVTLWEELQIWYMKIEVWEKDTLTCCIILTTKHLMEWPQSVPFCPIARRHVHWNVLCVVAIYTLSCCAGAVQYWWSDLDDRMTFMPSGHILFFGTESELKMSRFVQKPTAVGVQTQK